MSLPRYWTWDHEIRNLGCWPTRQPYAWHAEPVEIVTLADVRALVEEACQRLNPDVPIQYECMQLLLGAVAALKETP